MKSATADAGLPSVLFLIRSLQIGGSERQLIALAGGLRRLGHSVRIAVYYAGGALEADAAAQGIDLIDLRKKGRWELVAFGWRLVATLRRERPDSSIAFGHSQKSSPRCPPSAAIPSRCENRLERPGV